MRPTTLRQQAYLTEANQLHQRLLEAMQNRDSESPRTATVEAMRGARDDALQAWDRQECQGVGNVHSPSDVASQT